MKTIEIKQNIANNFEVDICNRLISVTDPNDDNCVVLDKQGAKQLIEVLKEWVCDETT